MLRGGGAIVRRGACAQSSLALVHCGFSGGFEKPALDPRVEPEDDDGGGLCMAKGSGGGGRYQALLGLKPFYFAAFNLEKFGLWHFQADVFGAGLA